MVGQPDRHPVDRLGHLTPGTRDPVDPGGTTQLALGTHLTGHPGHFLGETAHLLGHAVDRVGQTQQVTTEFTPTSVRGSPPVQLTRRDRVEDLCHIRHGLGDLVHHVVEGAGALGPGTPGRVDDQPLVESPLLAHDLTDPLQLTVELLTVIDDLVEHRGDLADRPAPPLTEANTEVAVPHAVQRLEYLVELFLGRFLDRLGHRTPPQPAWFAPVPHSFSGSTAVREARPTDVGQSHRTAKSCPVSGPSEAGKHTRCPHTLVVSCHVTVARHHPKEADVSSYTNRHGQNTQVGSEDGCRHGRCRRPRIPAATCLDSPRSAPLSGERLPRIVVMTPSTVRAQR